MRKVQSVGGAGKKKEDNDENFQICLTRNIKCGGGRLWVVGQGIKEDG